MVTRHVTARGRPAALFTTEGSNEQDRAVEQGIGRTGGTVRIRAALKSKGLVQRYGDRWNVHKPNGTHYILGGPEYSSFIPLT